MIVYVNGDSYVAGDGLAHDHLIGIKQGNFDNLTAEQRAKVLWHNTSLLSHPENIALQPKIREIENQKRFSTLIENNLGCRVINNARGGASFDRIARTTILDLIELRRTTDEKIKAIIGETAHYRMEVPRIEANTNKEYWYDLHIGHENAKDSKDLMFWMNRFMVSQSTDYHLYTKYFLNWIMLKNFCNSINVELHWCKVWGHDADVKKHKDLYLLFESAYMTPSVSMIDLSLTPGITRIAPDGGHYSEQVHQLVADEFVKKFKEQ